jgi:hypothetical protein
VCGRLRHGGRPMHAGAKAEGEERRRPEQEMSRGDPHGALATTVTPGAASPRAGAGRGFGLQASGFGRRAPERDERGRASGSGTRRAGRSFGLRNAMSGARLRAPERDERSSCAQKPRATLSVLKSEV